MTAETRFTLILATLQHLDTIHPRATSARQLIIPLTASGLPITLLEMESLLTDITTRGLTTAAPAELTPEVTIYARTEQGRVTLRKNGL